MVTKAPPFDPQAWSRGGGGEGKGEEGRAAQAVWVYQVPFDPYPPRMKFTLISRVRFLKQSDNIGKSSSHLVIGFFPPLRCSSPLTSFHPPCNIQQILVVPSD